MLGRIYAFTALTAAAVAVAVAGVHAAVPHRKADQDKVICQVAAQIGSHLAEKRVCLTRHQWRQQQEMMRQELDKVRIISGPGGG